MCLMKKDTIQICYHYFYLICDCFKPVIHKYFLMTVIEGFPDQTLMNIDANLQYIY